MNRTELVSAVSEKTGLPVKDAERAVFAALDTVMEAVKGGDKVSVYGFGVFSPKERAARKGRNPRTNAPIRIAASRSVGFAPATHFKDELKSRRKGLTSPLMPALQGTAAVGRQELTKAAKQLVGAARKVSAEAAEAASKTTGRKTTGRKATAAKTTAAKTTATKTPAKRATPASTPAKRATPASTPAKRAGAAKSNGAAKTAGAAKKATAAKSTGPAPRKTAAKRAPAKKAPATAKTPAKKTSARKAPAAKKR
jgi:DNA-binding protein HU-beta